MLSPNAERRAGGNVAVHLKKTVLKSFLRGVCYGVRSGY